MILIITMAMDMRDVYISSGGGYWAWVSGSHHLATYLSIAQENAGSRFAAAKEMMLYVGYTEDYIHPACSYSLSVMRREDLQDLFVPTWASFFLKLEKPPFNLALSRPVSRQLVLEGFSNFTGISGCIGAAIDQSCLPEYRDTYTALASILAEEGTLPCVQEFRKMFSSGLAASVTEARAFLHGCFDANPLFTGLGYGYSSSTNTLTEREYLARNTDLVTSMAISFILFSPQTNKTPSGTLAMN